MRPASCCSAAASSAGRSRSRRLRLGCEGGGRRPLPRCTGDAGRAPLPHLPDERPRPPADRARAGARSPARRPAHRPRARGDRHARAGGARGRRPARGADRPARRASPWTARASVAWPPRSSALPTSPYRFCDTEEELVAAVAELGVPCVVKPVMSSSGKGQSVVRELDGGPAAWEYATARRSRRRGARDRRGLRRLRLRDHAP